MAPARQLDRSSLKPAAYPPGAESALIAPTAVEQSHWELDVVSTRRPRRKKGTKEIKGELDIILGQTAEGQWIADEPFTNNFGIGDTANEAVSDLMETLKDYVDVLSSRRYSLAPHLRDHLRWLESRIT